MPHVTNIAIVGCGYVSDMYAATLGGHPELRLVAAFDRNERNLGAFAHRWPVKQSRSFQELLDERGVHVVLNLTSPRSHFSVSQACLEAGKHVYSEKPLAMNPTDAGTLVDMAVNERVQLAAAPCSLLSETAQTMWKALRDGVIGKVRLVYANFDDGMIAPNLSPWGWRNGCGVSWPAKDEFEVGCTFEHAGYVLTWLAAFFGAARRVTAFSSCQIPDKGIPVDKMAPDFTVGCIEYDDGVVARVTCGLVAPRDKSLMIVGDDGVIMTPDVRNDAGPVYVQRIPARGIYARLERRLNPIRIWLESRLSAVPWSGDWRFRERLPLVRRPQGLVVDPSKPVDFLRGPSELAEAIELGVASRLSGRLGLHITELISALQHPDSLSPCRTIGSTFDPIEPLPWAA